MFIGLKVRFLWLVHFLLISFETERLNCSWLMLRWVISSNLWAQNIIMQLSGSKRLIWLPRGKNSAGSLFSMSRNEGHLYFNENYWWFFLPKKLLLLGQICCSYLTVWQDLALLAHSARNNVRNSSGYGGWCDSAAIGSPIQQLCDLRWNRRSSGDFYGTFGHLLLMLTCTPACVTASVHHVHRSERRTSCVYEYQHERTYINKPAAHRPFHAGRQTATNDSQRGLSFNASLNAFVCVRPAIGGAERPTAMDPRWRLDNKNPVLSESRRIKAARSTTKPISGDQLMPEARYLLWC